MVSLGRQASPTPRLSTYMCALSVILPTEHAPKHAHPEQPPRAEGSLPTASFPRPAHPTPLLSRQHLARLSLLDATPMYIPASVANKRLTAKLNSLDATLTQNTGRGPSPLRAAICTCASCIPAVSSGSSNLLTCFSLPPYVITFLLPLFGTLFQVPYPVSPLLATLTKTPGVWVYPSHSGTPSPALCAFPFNFQLPTAHGSRDTAPPSQLFPFNLQLSTFNLLFTIPTDHKSQTPSGGSYSDGRSPCAYF
jgi:hypothetical protein